MIPTIEELDLDKLKTYNSDKKKSFEFLCYQLCYEQFHTEGSFTPIDDSGGGDGVEFYLTKPNGDEYGWQCKFFGRLNEGGRKQQIKTSLKKACENHRDSLKRWYLWTKLDFTTDEDKWFKNLKKEIKQEFPNVELIHRGVTDISAKLAKYPYVFSYFFGELILSDDWYKSHIEDVFQRNVTQKKYNSLLHSPVTAQENLNGYLGGRYLLKDIEYYLDYEDYDSIEVELKKSIEVIKSCSYQETITTKAKDIAIGCIDLITEFKLLARVLVTKINSESCTTDYTQINSLCKTYFQKVQIKYLDYSELYRLDWLNVKKEIQSEYDTKYVDNLEAELFNPLWILERFYKPICGLFSSISYITKTDVHITGRASKGKSHLALNIADQYKNNNWPVVFLYARDFTTTERVEDQIIKILNLPNNWTFDELAQRLNQSGKVVGVRSLIIIDGLNESPQWQTIWKDGLDRVRTTIAKHPNLLLITTVRDSYIEQIFDDYLSYDKDNSVTVYGLEDTAEDTVHKYCDFYKISLKGNSNIPQFFRENPLALKIFCEVYRSKSVELSCLSLFDIFESYVSLTNSKICETVGKNQKLHKNFLRDELRWLADYMFTNQTNEVPLKDVRNRLSDDELCAIEAEDLLFFRDWNRDEVVIFTYDLLAGYLIASDLISQCDDKEDFLSKLNGLWKNILFVTTESTNRLHPLFDDILFCLLILSFNEYGFWIANRQTISYNNIVFNSIMGLPTEVAKKNEVQICSYVSDLFNNKEVSYRDFYGSMFVENHPLNFNFINELLTSMTISERDLSWNIFIMNEYKCGHFKAFIEDFEVKCLDISYNEQRRSLYVQFLLWLLTSNCHKLRNDITRLLYLFETRFPCKIEQLLHKAFSINDPYVIERVLAATYGAVMTMFGNGSKDLLAHIAEIVYSQMYSENCQYHTSHWFINDYAIQIIKLAVKEKSELSNEIDLSRVKISTQITKDDIESWEETVEEFGGPIHMDFSNYTLGFIIPNGHSYSNPPLKKKARSYLYQRIKELGWSEELFAKQDSMIGELSFRYAPLRDLKKIDRFGKKYSWIAYYELAGILQANDMLNSEFMFYRNLWPEIDPSYPESRIEEEFHFNHHIDGGNSLSDWLEDNTHLNFEDIYFNHDREDIFVCAYGYFSDKNMANNRSRFTFIRPFIHKQSDKSLLLQKLKDQSFAHRWLPEIVEIHDTYYGEISIFEDSTPCNWTLLEFPATQSENDDYKDSILCAYLDEGKPFVSFDQFCKDLEDRGYPYNDNTMGIHVLMPTTDYHMEVDDESFNFSHISKEIVFSEGLNRRDNSTCLFDSLGRIAAFNLKKSIDDNKHYDFTYLRKDILDSFLKKHDYGMLWCVWGEKQPADNNYTRIDFKQIDCYK